MKKIFKLAIYSIALLASSLVIAASQHKVLLIVLPGCEYCTKAEHLLDRHGIKYTTSVSKGGVVPRLYVDGKYKGTGVDAVENWVNMHKRNS